MSMMTARRRQLHSRIKARTVELVRTSGKSVGEVCRELDLTETAVRRWVAQAEIDLGRRDGLTTAEREELSRLRHENRVLREERDILKKAAAFFAYMSTMVSPCGLARFFAAQVRPVASL
jgi:transposase